MISGLRYSLMPLAQHISTACLPPSGWLSLSLSRTCLECIKHVIHLRGKVSWRNIGVDVQLTPFNTIYINPAAAIFAISAADRLYFGSVLTIITILQRKHTFLP